MTGFGDKLRLPFKMINLSLKCSRKRGGGGGAPIYVVSSNFRHKNLFVNGDRKMKLKLAASLLLNGFVSGASVDISRVTRNLAFCSRYSLGSRQTEIEGTA